MCCYLLHFSAPVSPRHTTRHYLGFAENVGARLAVHRAGRGARLTQVAVERGISIELVRVWPGATRDDERRLKNRKEAPHLCPICNPRLAHVSLQLPLDLDWSMIDQDDADREWLELLAQCKLHKLDGYEAWYRRHLSPSARLPIAGVDFAASDTHAATFEW